MIALINAFLIDGTGRAPAASATVLTEGARILAAGRDIPAPASAEIIDLRGRTLMPGITEAHIHFGGPEDFASHPLLGGSATDRYADMRRKLLDYGITNARGAGDFEEDALSLRDAISRGELEGPRVWAPGKAFQPVGGHPAYTVWRSDPGILSNAVTSPLSPEAAKREVCRQAEAGVNHIKCFLADDNYMEPSHKSPKLDDSVLTAVVEQAHEFGLKVMVHCQQPSFAMQALSAGADSIEHLICAGHDGEPLPEGLAGAFLNNGAFLVPTLISGAGCGLSQKALDLTAAAVKSLFDAGVKIAVGTDSGTPNIPPGLAAHLEIELLAGTGIPPMDALVAATRNGAELVGSFDFGTIEPGKLADLIAVDGNPLDDISHTRNVMLVMKEGRIVRSRLGSSR